MERMYIAIDLKSFYASVECVERRLDPLTANLVVADSSRTEKTICLAVSPSLKAHGISGRARLFEVVQRVKEVNSERLSKAIKSGRIRKNEDGESVQFTEITTKYCVPSETAAAMLLRNYDPEWRDSDDISVQFRKQEQELKRKIAEANNWFD